MKIYDPLICPVEELWRDNPLSIFHDNEGNEIAYKEFIRKKFKLIPSDRCDGKCEQCECLNCISGRCEKSQIIINDGLGNKSTFPDRKKCKCSLFWDLIEIRIKRESERIPCKKLIRNGLFFKRGTVIDDFKPHIFKIVESNRESLT